MKSWQVRRIVVAGAAAVVVVVLVANISATIFNWRAVVVVSVAVGMCQVVSTNSCHRRQNNCLFVAGIHTIRVLSFA